MFSSLKVRNFRLYWFGMLISLIGTWIQTIAQSWLVFQLTDSVFLLGIVGFLGFFPIFLFSLFGGVVADRYNKKNIMLATQIAFMLLAFILAVLTQLKVITPLQIMLIAVLNGTVMAFDAPSRQAMVAELAGKQHLLNAIALNSAAFNSARIIGPALAGILIAAIGMSGCFYINGISFIAVIAALLLVKNNHISKNKGSREVIVDLLAGLRLIKNNRTILLLVIMVGITSLFGISYVILMPVFANNIFNVGVKGLGMLMSAAGIGALIAALLLAKTSQLRHKGKFMLFSCIVFSGALILFSLSRIYALSLITLAVIGWSSVAAISLINNALQVTVPDEFRGRVMSVFMFTFAGLQPFGNLIAGSLAHSFGVSLAIFINGLICTLFFLSLALFFPAIRKI